ncbi:MAG: Nif3-like dinuclear metal center hexameric protein [Clostridia bacterium]|nr:Nif3-like dinuclear metal center hexameric protein [Clostridia bacterium]
MLTVQQVYDFINDRAPFESQVAYDNSGLLVGDPARTVTGIHLALDVTPAVIDEAVSLGANLVVSHHPLMFSPINRLVETGYEAHLLCRLIREGISLISAHTNLDQAPGGINDVLAAAIGLENLSGEGFLRVGDLPRAMSAAQLAEHISQRLGDTVRLMGDGDRIVTRVGMCSGSGSDEWPQAAAQGAQAFLTGEAKHHHALEAAASGMIILEAGHHATEAPGIFALADALQNWENIVQCNVRVSKSAAPAYHTPVRQRT